MTRQWKIAITIDKDLYLELEERAKKEARTLSNLGKYFFLKGLQAEKDEQNKEV